MSASPPQGRGSHASSPSGSQKLQSLHEIDTDIPLPELITYLLASKRSLSSISTVWRANELVTSARSSLETAVVLEARNDFLRRGISQQARVLRKLKTGVEGAYKDGVRDFQEVLQSLDAADIRLQKTIDVLRSTLVESSFRPEGEDPRSLLHFIDETGVETLRTSLKESIDESQNAQSTLLNTVATFSNDLSRLKSTMTAQSPSASQTQASSTSIPPVLRNLENTAAEMAQLLDSLVSHFDLCVNAIKHTSGGFAAIKQVASSQIASGSNAFLPDGVTVSGVIRDAEAEAGAGPSAEEEEMSDEDRKQMLTVLTNDAAEVEDVVAELNQLLASMEDAAVEIDGYVSQLNAAYATTISAFSVLDGIAARLPSYLVAADAFGAQWIDHKHTISQQMGEVEGMRSFYDGYLSSYNNLILEVVRRHGAEEKMKSVLRKAMEQVRKLHVVDSRERERFRREVGDFIPNDLWAGLRGDAPRWEVGLAEGEDDEIGTSTPALDKEVIEEARRRAGERGGRI